MKKATFRPTVDKSSDAALTSTSEPTPSGVADISMPTTRTTTSLSSSTTFKVTALVPSSCFARTSKPTKVEAMITGNKLFLAASSTKLEGTSLLKMLRTVSKKLISCCAAKSTRVDVGEPCASSTVCPRTIAATMQPSMPAKNVVKLYNAMTATPTRRAPGRVRNITMALTMLKTIIGSTTHFSAFSQSFPGNPRTVIHALLPAHVELPSKQPTATPRSTAQTTHNVGLRHHRAFVSSWRLSVALLSSVLSASSAL
mmetsp:Transcript_51544/g.144002  ORF Transcript_51544/g.144002 Transcript_51544/m.144002 type:complete len:256 (+) Transcript_51544:112-879(+)